MSMWEIEALMENTIRLIDKSNFKAQKKRNLIWNTYHIQNQFDCSFTHFRLMDVLVGNEYVQQYSIDDFPMASTYPDFFAELSNKEFEWIHQNPTKKWSENNPAIAYWDQKSSKIGVDFGSKFYTKNKEETPKEYEPLHFGYKIIKEAYRQQDEALVYDWTSFMVTYLLAFFPSNKSTAELKELYFSDIKEIFHQFDYTDYKILHEGLSINDVPEDWLEEMSEHQKELIPYLTQQ